MTNGNGANGARDPMKLACPCCGAGLACTPTMAARGSSSKDPPR
jgi:hypothetical protein